MPCESPSHRIDTSCIHSEGMIEDHATLPVDKAACFVPTASKKRKRAATPTPKSKGQVMDLTQENENQAHSPPAKKNKGASARKAQNEEKRSRRFRPHAPSSYLERLNRATTQRMFVIDRTRGGTIEIPEETIVLHNVLRAPEHLQYQLAFLSSELREIFAAAPATASTSASSDAPSNRKEVSGDCPICFTELEAETEDSIVWCRAACGNNLHKDCFEQWARSQAGKEIRCVYCRTPWKRDEESLERVKNAGKVNGEGYVNVAGELGLSGARDNSTYHQHWVRRRELGYF